MIESIFERYNATVRMLIILIFMVISLTFNRFAVSVPWRSRRFRRIEWSDLVFSSSWEVTPLMGIIGISGLEWGCGECVDHLFKVCTEQT
ncbi:MAG: hypothetical protein R2827_05165 [Bdellovibrionales bacterium]